MTDKKTSTPPPRQKHGRKPTLPPWRVADAVAVTGIVIVVIWLWLSGGLSEENQASESQQIIAPNESIYVVSEEAANEEVTRLRDSIDNLNRQLQDQTSMREHEEVTEPKAIENAENAQEKPEFDWSRVEFMVRDIVKHDYSAYVWKVSDNTPKCIVMYTKDGKEYVRKIDPESYTCGKAIQIRNYESNHFYVVGNKSRCYKILNHDVMVYEVNGKEIERYYNRQFIHIPQNDCDHYDEYDLPDY